ncbi:hypothetical protein LX87_03230 [Larkinella arboricola]|uniref:Outer membrane protein with beta-barrel domain n=1 Tax=Larkinella arboricola TaxID=643671 RepID=A0A327WT30_LARAB|nr:hypothetical protein [Larkinella arboricola]RAJ95484.1 hypothetical protein LX87_03230 [Larkinella arboricola]
MKTISTLLVGFVLWSNALLAQSPTTQIGLNAVPLLNRTLELSATWTKSPHHEFFAQGGYTFPTSSSNGNRFQDFYWEGTTRGAYLRLGARAFFNPSDRFRLFLGFHITNGYVKQAGKNTTVLNCLMAPCPALEREAQQDNYLLSAGFAGGVRTSITQRLAVDLGMQFNSFVGGKPELMGQDIYTPGYGRKPLQPVATVHYTLKGR